MIQLKRYQERYKYLEGLDNLTVEEDKQLKQISEEMYEKMRINVQYLPNNLYKFSSVRGIRFVHPKARNSAIIFHYLISNENVEWINCSCGGLGKFRRIK